MNVLVTGGYGFIGSHLIKKLYKEGHFIVNIDKLTYSSNIDNIPIEIQKSNKYVVYHIDIVESDHIYDIIKLHKINNIIHLAGECHVDRSILDPLKFIQTNVNGTCSLLMAANKYFKDNNITFFYASTDEVYGSISIGEVSTEQYPINPSSPYSSSKAAAELMTLAFYKTYKLPVVIFSLANVFGPHKFPDSLIPKTIVSCINKTNIITHGTGKQIRLWNYISDVVNAIVFLINNGKHAEKYNISSETEISVNDIIEIIINKFNLIDPFDYDKLIINVPDRKGQDFRYSSSAKKMKSLGFYHSYAFDEALDETINWYIKNKNFFTITEKDDIINGNYIINS
jgi:dTDP-glucose 4,6-dehydratase